MNMKQSVVFLGLYSLDHINTPPFEYNRYDDIWSLNEYYNVYPGVKATRVFQIHTDFSAGINDDWIRAYNQRKTPVVTVCPIPGLKSPQTMFPVKEAFDEVGQRFFTSTFSYMFYMAVKEGYKKIRLVGIRLKMKSEYEYQRMGLLLNIKWAEENGVKVENPRQKEFENDFKWRGYKITWDGFDKNFVAYGQPKITKEQGK